MDVSAKGNGNGPRLSNLLILGVRRLVAAFFLELGDKTTCLTAQNGL
jgi:hypothetical protein